MTMKAKEKWKPSKYIYRKGKLKASRDRNKVAIELRLICDLIAKIYDDNIKKYVTGKLLDLGCGTVPLYIAYKDYIDDNICIDWHKNDYIDHCHNLIEKLPLNDEIFDTVIMSDVLEHIPEPEMIISEIYRVLKLNGKLLLNVPFYYCIHEAPHDFYRFTEFALRYLLEKVGFKIIKLEFIGGPVEVIADVIIKNTAHISLLGNPLAIFLQWITLLYTKTKIGKKINRAAAHKFPLGYFVVGVK